MNTRTAACTALVAVAALTAGCSGGKSDGKAPSTPKATATAAAQTTPSPSPSSGPLAFGSAWSWSDTDDNGKAISGTTTALSYTQPVKTGLPDEAADFPNPEWAVLEVKVCINTSSASVTTSQGPWALGYPDDTRINAPNISGSGVPKPEYATPDGATITPGDCLRGKITFSVAKGTRPDRIVYSAAGRDAAEWTVPKA